MPKELVISAAPHETRVAILEDGLLCEIYIEREKEFALVGSIYKGRVTRVLPGMQSAFVEIGLDSDAFLYVGDFLENLEDYDHVVTTVEGKVEKMEQQGGTVFTPAAPAGAAGPSGGDQPAAPAAAAEAPLAEGEEADDQRAVGLTMPAPRPPVEEEDLDERQPASLSQGAPPSSPRYGTPQPPYPRQDRGPSRFGQGQGPAQGQGPSQGQGRDRGGDRGGGERDDRGGRRRGGRWRGGRSGDRGGRPGGGRDLPPAKYASSRPFSPRPQRPYEPPPPSDEPTSNLPPIILPGESLAKYRDRPAPGQPGAATAPATAETSAVGLPSTLYTQSAGHVVSEPPEFTPPAAEPSEPLSETPAAPGTGTHAVHADLSDEEVSALAEGLAEARHEEANAQAEANAGPSLLEEEEPLVPESAAESEEFATEAEEQEHEDALAAHDEGEGEADQHFGESAADNAHAEAEGSDEESDQEEDGPQPQAEQQPTSARVGQPNRPRFQRPMRHGRRGRSGGRPFRSHDNRQQQQRRPQLISEMLKPGQEILVQIAKEPLGKKGARITSHVALPGRFLVYMPTVNHVGVSRRIGSAEERQRLRRLVGESKGTFPGGFIVRTAAEGAPDDEIRSDVEFLGRTWEKIIAQSEPRKAPALLHRDLNLVERILRDYVSNDYTAIWIDNQDEYGKVVEFVGRFQPKLVNRVKLYTKGTPIFEEFGIQQELDKALRPKVWLKSGGYIVINHTEALVAIDVNTGKYVGRGSTRLEDTIVKTNLEAVKEIVRQIRLRDLGGIIVLDFIDMEERRNREKVMAALDSALRSDRAPSKALSFNEFGLVAVTRKRTKQALERVLCQPCPYCTGSGMVKSIPTICYEIQAEARKMSPDLEASSLTLRVHPEIAKALKTREASLVEELEQNTRKSVIIQADPTLHWEQYDIY